MHKQLLNECRISGTLTTSSPVLVRSAVETIAGPDVGTVLTVRGGLDQPYLPGSSLKGALRSQAERIARTLRPNSACNPVDDRGPMRFCGRRLEEREREQQRTDRRYSVQPHVAYRDSCAACKLFGSTAVAGRVSVTDAYLLPGIVPALIRRDGVGIDRFSGSASLRSRYEIEAVTDVSFRFDLRLTNFELWQLGLVGLAVQDLLNGRLPLGTGKSRGLGQVTGALDGVEVAYLRGSQAGQPDGALAGVGTLAEDGGRYGYRSDDRLEASSELTAEQAGIRRIYRYQPEQVPWDALTEALITYLEQHYRPSPWFGREGEGEEVDAARARQPAR